MSPTATKVIVKDELALKPEKTPHENDDLDGDDDEDEVGGEGLATGECFTIIDDLLSEVDHLCLR